MFRFSLVVCVSLIFGITAKPYKPWNKIPDGAVQDTMMSMDGNGKLSWGVEVEPKEDMDETTYDIDPQMKIWKNMAGSGQDKQPLKPEEDLDDLFHPSVTELLRSQVQNVDAIPADDIQTEPLKEIANMKSNQGPEEDRDDIDHPVFNEGAWEEPEQDLDDVYHTAELDKYLAPMIAGYKAAAEIHVEPKRNVKAEPVRMQPLLRAVRVQPLLREVRVQPLQREVRVQPLLREVRVQPLQREVRVQPLLRAVRVQPLLREVRVHPEPEEDLDDLYHKDVLQPVPDVTEDVVPVDVPSQRKYSEPEEDLDAMYHP